MIPKEAGRVVTYLTAKFPFEALEPEALSVYAKDVALLVDYEVALVAADELGRAQDRFPSIRQFRDAYHSVARRRAGERAETHGLPAGKVGEAPEWVHVWWWARHTRRPREERNFPQMVEPDGGLPFSGDYLTTTDYAALLVEWREVGAPLLGRLEEVVGTARQD